MLDFNFHFGKVFDRRVEEYFQERFEYDVKQVFPMYTDMDDLIEDHVRCYVWLMTDQWQDRFDNFVHKMALLKFGMVKDKDKINKIKIEAEEELAKAVRLAKTYNLHGKPKEIYNYIGGFISNNPSYPKLYYKDIDEEFFKTCLSIYRIYCKAFKNTKVDPIEDDFIRAKKWMNDKNHSIDDGKYYAKTYMKYEIYNKANKDIYLIYKCMMIKKYYPSFEDVERLCKFSNQCFHEMSYELDPNIKFLSYYITDNVLDEIYEKARRHLPVVIRSHVPKRRPEAWSLQFLNSEEFRLEYYSKRRVKKHKLGVKIMIREKIINMIPSKYMRDHLLKKTDDLYMSDYVNIIADLPIRIEKKKALLQEMLDNWDEFPKKDGYCEPDKKEISSYIDFLDIVAHQLKYFQREYTVAILKYIRNERYEDDDCINPYHCYDSTPVPDFDGALRLIEKDVCYAVQYHREKEEDITEKLSHRFYKIELYKLKNDEFIHKYTYTLNIYGEILYVDTEYNTNLPDIFKGAQSTILPTPYQPGDILYVDGRPFCNPGYCLIFYIEEYNDCCAVRSLYRQENGYVYADAFRHGHYGENNTSDLIGYIKITLCAEKYEGELPEGYSCMKEISDMIKADPKLGEKLHNTYIDKNKYTLEQIAEILKRKEEE